MNLIQSNITIRNATPTDAPQLATWWNDGTIMAHAGFPNGLGTTAEAVATSLAKDSDNTHRRHIIAYHHRPIGEMNYRNVGQDTAEIGIKICDPTQQEKGLGSRILSMFIDALFCHYGYEKIILDTNVNNHRAQHVYENKLGFTKVQTRHNSWIDPLGQPQSYIDYALTKADWLAQNHAPQYIHLRHPHPGEARTLQSISRDAHWGHEWDMTPQPSDVPLLVHRLCQCDAYIPALHYVAEVGGQPVGHILYTAAHVLDASGKSHSMVTFGPLSVLPAFQGQGIGRALVEFSAKAAAGLGYQGICIFGHSDYYPRFGFKPGAHYGITTAEGKSFDSFMALPLYENALAGIQGTFHIHPAYDNLAPEDIAAFEANFPPKALHQPVPIEVLLDQLSPTAQEALADTKGKSLAYMQTKSHRAVSSLPGIDQNALDTIRKVMAAHGHPWGLRQMNDYQQQALVWDWDAYDNSPEYDRICQLASTYGKNILLPMCALGEMGAYMAGQGFTVTAFDITPEMIAQGQCRHGDVRGLHLAVADLLALDLPQKDFDFVYIGGSGDLHLLMSLENVEKAFRSLHKHMRPGACLYLELTLPGETSNSSPKQTFHPRVPRYTDKKIWKENQSAYNATTQQQHITQTVYVEDAAGTRSFTQEIRLQYWSPDEITALLQRCGFAIASKQTHDVYSWSVAGERI